jgi:hypothetical protein
MFYMTRCSVVVVVVVVVVAFSTYKYVNLYEDTQCGSLGGRNRPTITECSLSHFHIYISNCSEKHKINNTPFSLSAV